MAYTSNPGGLYNSGVYPSSRPQVQVAPILEALTGGASTLIHGAMVRRQAQNEMALRAQQFGLEQQREAREASHQSAQLDMERTREAREGAAQIADRELRATESRRKFITEGGIPEHTETQPRLDLSAGGPTASIAALNPPSPISQAMTSQLPGVQTTPGAGVAAVPAAPAPSPSTVNLGTTVSSTKDVTVPESYDPTRAAGYVKARDLLGIKNDEADKLQAARLASQQKGREYNGQVRVQVERENNSAKKGRADSAITKAMTGNANEARLEKIAAGTLEAHDGDYQQTIDDLTDTEDGIALMKRGLTPEHIMGAYGKYKAGMRGMASRIASGPNGDTPEGAVATVKKIDQALDGKKKPKAISTPQLKTSTGSPFVGGTPGNVTLPGTGASAAAPAVAPAPVTDESKMSDADLWEAKVKAGMPKDKATAYVRSRKKA